MTPAVCVITGSASGIGLAITKRMLDAGFIVIGVDVDSTKLDATRDQIASERYHTMQGDVSRFGLHAEVTDRAGELGALRCWVSNAGFRTSGSVHDISPDEYDRCVAVYLTASFWGTAAAVRSMIANGEGGSIINISSRHAEATSAGMAAYAMCKGGINSLTRQVAGEYAHTGIRCNAVAPGLSTHQCVAKECSPV